MAMISVPVPRDVSRLFTSLDIEGNRDPSDHITVIHLGDALPINTIVKAIPLIYDITSKMEPFLVTAKKITTFPKGDNGYPIIAPVEAPQLRELHSKLKRVFDRRGVGYSDKYPEYAPHVTLGYYKRKTKNIKLPKTQWQVNEIGLYGGDAHDERLYVSFPLALNIPVKKSADYILRLAQGYGQMAANLKTFFQQLLFDMKLFHYDPVQNQTDKYWLKHVWVPILEKTKTYGAYNIDVTIPAGTLTARFSGTPVNLIAYLNENVAPRIAANLAKAKGKKMHEWTIAEPPNDVTFKYLESLPPE